MKEQLSFVEVDPKVRYKQLVSELQVLSECIRPELVQSPSDTINYITAKLLKEEKEVFCILFLNTKNKIIDCEIVNQGTLNQVVIYPRNVAISCLKNNASAVIVAHNHPSGEPEPSGADIRLTESLKNALATLEIKLLDHMIIGSIDSYFSFLEEGLI